MKKTAILLTTICASALLWVSCSSNDDSGNTQTIDFTNLAVSQAIDASTAMDVNTGLLVTANSSTAKTAETQPGICAAITVTTPEGASYPKVFLLDFGTAGCKDDNLTRKGKLKITLTGPIYATGSVMSIERIDYYINNLKLEGTIEYKNTTTVATVPQWTRKVTNGKLTDLQGGVYTNSGSYTTRQTAGVDTPSVLADNVYDIIDGSHTVTAPGGTTITLTVLEALTKKYSCTFISKGRLKIQGGIINGIIDYGNNECDAIYIYTHEDGKSYSFSM